MAKADKTKTKQLSPEEIEAKIESVQAEPIEESAPLPEVIEEVKPATLIGKTVPQTPGKPSTKSGTVSIRNKVTGKIIAMSMDLQRAQKQVRDFPNLVEIV